MKELPLPHKKPIRFAQYTLSRQENIAIVRVEFNYIPSLAMIVESAAQSSAAFSDNHGQIAFLISLKNIEQFQELEDLAYDVEVVFEQQVGDFKYFTFKMEKQKNVLARGTFILAIQT